jgi:hypothetical protein
MSQAQDHWNFIQPKTKMSITHDPSWKNVDSSSSLPGGYVVVPVDEDGGADRPVKIPWGSDKEVQGPMRSVLEKVRQRLGSTFLGADAIKVRQQKFS